MYVEAGAADPPCDRLLTRLAFYLSQFIIYVRIKHVKPKAI